MSLLDYVHTVLMKHSLKYKMDSWNIFGTLDFLHAKKAESAPISDRFVNILVAAEDKRYWSHHGYDVYAIFRSIFFTIKYLKPYGGSTITQQLVRVVTGNFEKSLKRKICELVLSHQVSKKYRKDFLAKEYLARAYYGWRMNDINEACLRLGKNLRSLSYEDEVYLAALLKYPLPQFPASQRQGKIKLRTGYIDKRMQMLGYKK